MGSENDPKSQLPTTPFDVVCTLATGGMAEIYLGRRKGPSGFQRPVVIKKILPHLARNKQFVDMFLDEARIAASINHPNIIHVEELSHDGEGLFMVMEYLAGETLSDLNRHLASKGRPFEPDLAAFVIAEACAGLHAAHEVRGEDGRLLGTVHRDVSPQNIFVTYDGTVKVLDFGVAKARDRLTKTESGYLKGKFDYMSPEQVRGEPLDRRSDIFALGVVLYETITGRRLFKRTNGAATIRAVLEHSILPPSEYREAVPDELERVCLKALSRSRRRRYTSAADVRRELITVIHSSQSEGLPEQRLSSLMNELFEKRIRTKSEMLRQVESDEELEIAITTEPSFYRDLPTIESGPRTEVSRSTERSQRRPRIIRPLVLALTALVVLGAGIVGFSFIDPSSPRVIASLGEGEVRPSSPSGRVDSGSRSVRVEVVTEPSGAVVTVNGERRMKTPGVMFLPRLDESVRVTVSLDGYKTIEDDLVANVDQRFRLNLVAESDAEVLDISDSGRPKRKGRRHGARPRDRLKAQSPPPPGIPLWD